MTWAPALAGFGYAPATSDRRTVVVEERSATSLVEVARRLVPAGVKLRWDRRVEAGQSVRGVYGDWESVLFDAGLAWNRYGDEVHVRPAGLPAGEVQLASVGEGVADWRVKAEETLEAALARWGARAGVDVLWLTDRSYVLHEERTFRGTWSEAVGALLSALSGLAGAPAAELRDGFGTLAVMHRPTRGRKAQ